MLTRLQHVGAAVVEIVDGIVGDELHVFTRLELVCAAVVEIVDRGRRPVSPRSQQMKHNILFDWAGDCSLS